MFIQKRKIVANEEVDIAPEASDLLFEAEDVAELVAEVTGQPVEVTADETSVEFTVGEDVYTVEAEGDEEVLEATRRNFRGKRAVKASAQRKVSSGTKTTKPVRKFSK